MKKRSHPKIRQLCYKPEKKKFFSQSDAARAAQLLQFRAYQCGDHWHLTSDPTRRAERR